jgi:hypothetical protein
VFRETQPAWSRQATICTGQVTVYYAEEALFVANVFGRGILSKPENAGECFRFVRSG